MGARRLDAQRVRQPDRLPDDEAFDVLAANERDVLAEAFAIEGGQLAPMLGLFFAHLGEQPRAGRIVLAKPLGKIGVNALVLLLERDGQRQDLPLGEVAKALHDARDFIRRTTQSAGKLLPCKLG